MKIYNTLSRSKEEFVPLEEGKAYNVEKMEVKYERE